MLKLRERPLGLWSWRHRLIRLQRMEMTVVPGEESQPPPITAECDSKIHYRNEWMAGGRSLNHGRSGQ